MKPGWEGKGEDTLKSDSNSTTQYYQCKLWNTYEEGRVELVKSSSSEAQNCRVQCKVALHIQLVQNY